MAKMHIADPDYPNLVLCGRTKDGVRRNVVPMDWAGLMVTDCRTCLLRRESRRLRLPNPAGQPPSEARSDAADVVGRLRCTSCRGSGIRTDHGRYGYPCERCHGYGLEPAPNTGLNGSARPEQCSDGDKP